MSRFKDLAKIDKKRFSEKQASEEGETGRVDNGMDFTRPDFIREDILEKFMGMRESLFKKERDPRVKAVGITSSKHKEGKTRVSICLAVASSLDPARRVLLVDGSLRTPGIHEFFGIPMSPGFSELILEERELKEVIYPWERFPLNILPSGNMDTTPIELFTDRRFPGRMEDLKNAFDIIIVDIPNVKRFADFELIGKYLDGMILVLEADKTQLPLMLEAKARLENAGIPILGAMINRVKNPIPAFISKRIGL